MWVAEGGALFYKLRTHYDGCTLLRSYNHLRSALRAKSNPGPVHTIVCTGCWNGKGVKGLVRPAARRARTRPLDPLEVTHAHGRGGGGFSPPAPDASRARVGALGAKPPRFSCQNSKNAIYRKTAYISKACKTIPAMGIESRFSLKTGVRSWRGAPTTAALRAALDPPMH